MKLAENSRMPQYSNRQVEEPIRLRPKISRAMAGFGLAVSVLLALLAGLMFTFAQVIPAILTLAIALGLGMFFWAGLTHTLPPSVKGESR